MPEKCQICGVDALGDDGFQLVDDLARNKRGCDHIYCTGCLVSKLWATLPSMPCCPANRCTELVWGFKRSHKEGSKTREKVVVVESEVDFARKLQPDEWIMPEDLRQFAASKFQDKIDSFAVCLLTPKKDGTHETWAAVLRSGTTPGPEAVKAIKQLGAHLFTYMVKPDSMQYGKDLPRDRQVLTMSSIIEFALQTNTMTHLFMRQLAGVNKPLPTLDSLKQSDQNSAVEVVRRIVAPYLLTQVLECLQAPKSVGPVKAYFNGMFATMRPWRLAEIGRIMGLSSGPKQFWKGLMAKESTLIEALAKCSPRDFFTGWGDNMGFRKTGGFMQTCIHGVNIIPWQKIKDIGCHLAEMWTKPSRDSVFEDPEFTMDLTGDGQQTLVDRRVRLWNEVVCLAEAIDEPNTVEDQEASREYSEGTQPVVTSDSKGTLALAQRLVGAGGEANTDPLTANNGHVLEPLYKDFAKTDVLLELVDCWADIRKDILNKPLADGEVKEGEIAKPLEVCDVPVLTDGKPAIQLLAEKRKGTPIMSNFQPFAGGFHKVKEGYTLTGKQHLWTVLQPLLHALGRVTDGQKKWVTKPGDPNDCAVLFREASYAARVAIARDYKRKVATERAAEGCDVEGGTPAPTPYQLESYMLERASVCPAAMSVVLWLRDMEIIHWMEDTERDGDQDRAFREYRQVLPLLQRIHVVNNATNYTHMTAWEMLRWKLECPAVIKVMANFGYTTRTTEGKLEFGDRAVENQVRAGRSVLGDRWGKGHAKKMRGVMVNLRSLMISKKVGDWFTKGELQDADGEDGGGSAACRVRGVQVSDHFLKAIDFFQNTRVFEAGDGDIKPYHAVGGDSPQWRSNKAQSATKRGALVGLDGAELDPAYFKVNDIADARARLYADAAIRDDFEFKSPIPDVKCLAKSAAASSLDAWRCLYSADVAFLKSSSVTKDFIYGALQDLKALDVTSTIECLKLRLPSKSSSKAELATLLSQARKTWHLQHAPPPPPVQSEGGQLGQGGFPMHHWQMQNLLPE